MEIPPRMEVTTDVVLPVVAAAIPVVSAPRRTCAPIATLRDQPVILAGGTYASRSSDRQR